MSSCGLFSGGVERRWETWVLAILGGLLGWIVGIESWDAGSGRGMRIREGSWTHFINAPKPCLSVSLGPRTVRKGGQNKTRRIQGTSAEVERKGQRLRMMLRTL